jgi:hypothetical protein
MFLLACGNDTSKTPDASTTHDAPGAVDAAPIALDCNSYCTAILGACTSANAQYSSMANCVDSCGHFDVGTSPATTGNTLACRVYHTGVARMNPNTHCIHAGPSGGGVCGTSCEGFCKLAVPVCPTQYQTAQCPGACAGFATTPPYSSNVSTGDSFACRMYHLTEAATDSATHCGHTGVTATAFCM